MELSETVVEPLRRVARWLAGLRDVEGRIVCPVHRLEHTGKSAGAAVLAAELARLDPADAPTWADLALQQGRRLVARLEREGTSPCHTFRPGMHDPFNCSNNVIDGGACSDALAHLVQRLGERLPAADREAFAAAALLHARTYLRYAVLDKGVPAQRAWGLTGLAAAWSLAPEDDELLRAALEAVGALEAIQHEDGSYPYQPIEWTEGAAPGPAELGASDVSSFYQSRVTAFLTFALERLGRDPRDPLFGRALFAGLEFLAALQGPDGIKCGLVEAKPWYWGATYEVASHPFDVYALARGAELFGRPAHGRAAARAFRAWVDHLGPDGEPSSHRPGPGRGRSFQCPVFWAAHAQWIARAAEPLARLLERGEEREPGPAAGLDLAVTWFPRAQLGRLEDGRVVAWVRGARPGGNASHGSPHGAGLLRVVSKADGGELIERCPLGGAQEGEWSGRSGGPSAARARALGRGELSFAAWRSRVELRAGRPMGALRAPVRALVRGVLAQASPTVSSAFALDPHATVLGDGLVLESGLAWRGGQPVPGSRLERRYQLDGEGLQVRERLVDPGTARHVRYRVPARASAVREGGGEVAYRLT